MTGSHVIRAFVAVELSSRLQSQLAALQVSLQKTLPSIAWVQSESIHLTLKFLGHVQLSHLPGILTVLESVGEKQQTVCISVQGLGVFPHIRHPRVFWAGCSGNTSALQELVFEIEAALEPLGFPSEDKLYHPHLTLGRIKRENGKFGEALRKSKLLDGAYEVGDLTITKFVLYRSDLAASGPTYTPLGTIQLSGNGLER